MGSMMVAQSDSRQPCTILLPLFNGANFLSQSIENLCKIAGPDDEILIIDDGSTDITKQEIEALCKLDPRIIVHFCRHRGLVIALNYGIQNASHEFIARADVDDTYDYKRISVQVQYLANHPEVSAVFSDYNMVDLSGRILGLFPSAISPELTALSLINSQRTPHPSVMYRKSAVIAVGGYLPEDFPAEDLALWIRLAKVGKIASIPQVLLSYTIHKQSVTKLRQLAMQEKSLALRKEYALEMNWFELLESANILRAVYTNYPRENLRSLFFFHDLIKLGQFTGSRYRRIILRIILSEIFRKNVFLITPIFSAMAMKLKRRNTLF
jgi:glycosyltransferase involved in cell wall biosynthesis